VDVVDVFGDHTPETHMIPGPVLGYYVGLDLVIAAAALSAVTGLLYWLVSRRRRAAHGMHKGAPDA
jgi:hypothetical protein